MKKFLLIVIILFFSFLYSEEIKKISFNNKNLICIHGFLSNSRTMYFFKKNFKKHHWNVIN